MEGETEMTAHEIEITPTMIAAALVVLEGAYLGDGRYALTDEVVAATLLSAMTPPNNKVDEVTPESTAEDLLALGSRILVTGNQALAGDTKALEKVWREMKDGDDGN